MPYFSVIVPLFNKEPFILETLKSIINQSFQDFEVILVDDGSTDFGLQEVKKLNDPRLKVFSQENKGAGVTRNNGINMANAPYIALLDADDSWHENHLLELKKQIDMFPNAGLYCNNYEIFYSELVSRKAQFNFEFSKDCIIVKDYFKASIINSVAWTSAVAFSKNKFEDVGGFDPKLKTAQDLDLWIRFALKYEVSFNPNITMSYKFHITNSLSKNENEYNLIRYYFINKFREEEKTIPSLKLYLDINRYSLAIRSKLNGQKELCEKVKKDINPKNLNWKQKILLQQPKFILKCTKRLQGFLIKKKLYLTSYK